MRLLPLLTSYHRTKRLRFTDRTTLARHQAHMLGRFFQQTLTKSPYFSAMMGDMLHREFDPKKFATLPTMDKTTILAHFNQMNTAGLDKEQAFALALQAEKDRDFSPTLHGIEVLGCHQAHQDSVAYLPSHKPSKPNGRGSCSPKCSQKVCYQAKMSLYF